MTDRRPIYSAQAAGQQIGYTEGDGAFDLFDRPCAIYDSNTGLLRDAKNNAVVGYVSLADIFVGSSWMAQELFSKSGPVGPRASLEKLEDGHFDVPVCGAEDGNAENVDAARLIAQAQSHHAAKTDLSVTSTALHSETASVKDHVPHATDITTFASSSQQDNPSAEAQKDMDRVPFPGEPEPLEGESSGFTQHSGSPVEMAQDNHREGNSGAGGGIETNNTSWDMARILLGVPKDVEKNSSSA